MKLLGAFAFWPGAAGRSPRGGPVRARRAEAASHIPRQLFQSSFTLPQGPRTAVRYTLALLNEPNVTYTWDLTVMLVIVYL